MKTLKIWWIQPEKSWKNLTNSNHEEQPNEPFTVKHVHAGWSDFEKENLDTFYVVPISFKTPIPKFHIFMLFFRSLWIFKNSICRFFGNWTHKNIPGRQHSARSRKSQKLLYHSTLVQVQDDVSSSSHQSVYHIVVGQCIVQPPVSVSYSGRTMYCPATS